MARPPKDITARINEMVDEREAEAVVQEAAMVNPPPAADILDAQPPEDLTQVEPPITEDLQPEIQKVGFTKWIQKQSEKVATRVTEAEKKVLPGLPDEPIQDIGGMTIIREADPDEIRAINEAIGGEYVKGINLPAIAAADGTVNLAEYLAKLKDANKDLFETARRGTLGYDQLMNLAEKQGMDHIVDYWLGRKRASGETAEMVLAGLIGARQLSKAAQEQFLRASTINDPEKRAQEMSRFLQLATAEMHLYANISGGVSEAARTTWLMSHVKRMGIDTARGDELIKLFDLENTENIEIFGRMYMALPDQAARAKFVQHGWMSRGSDIMAEAYINAILSAPSTHLVNVAGNSAFITMRSVEQMAAGAIGRARTALGIGSKDRAYVRDGLIQLDAIREAGWDALIVAGKAFIKEQPSDLVSKIDVRNRKAISMGSGEIFQELRKGHPIAAAVNAFGQYTRLAGRFLLAEDEFFKGISARASLRKQAFHAGKKLEDELLAAGTDPAEALARGKQHYADMLNNPNDIMKKTAKEEARELTFQKDLDGFLGSLQPGTTNPILKLFMPFYKTPANIAKEVLARSPLRIAHPNLWKNLSRGDAVTDAELSRLAVGTVVMGGFSWYSWDGNPETDKPMIITGSGPSDPKAAQAMRRLNLMPYSICKRGEDGKYTCVSYNRLDPISGTLAIAADFAYYANYETDQSVLESLAQAAVLSTYNYMLQQPYLQGVSELGASISNPDEAKGFERVSEMLGEKLATGFISVLPTVSSGFATIEREVNPAASSSMMPTTGIAGEDPTQLPAFVRGFYTALQKAKARHPFFSDEVPPALNLWGEVILQTDPAIPLEGLSPIRIQKAEFKGVDAELVKLGRGVAMPGKKISGVLLNAEQYNRWLVLMNEIDSSGKMPNEKGYDENKTLLPYLNELIKTDDYQSLDKEDKIEIIRSIVAKYKRAGKVMMLMEYPDVKARVEAAK